MFSVYLGMPIAEKIFSKVNQLWEQGKGKPFCQDEVGFLVFRSNILGSDLRITNFGGGNTSAKTSESDPLTGENVKILWVKGSGGDLGSMNRSGLAALYLEKLERLKGQYRGLAFEDEMVGKFQHCIFDLLPAAPSIDTALHAFLPYNHIDHLHPDSVIAIAAATDGEKICDELYSGEIGWVPWQRPGFDLALKLEAKAKEKNYRGIILAGHGLFTWGNTSEECFFNSIEIIEKAAAFLHANYGNRKPVFGGSGKSGNVESGKETLISEWIPALRGFAGNRERMIGHFSNCPEVLEFVNSNDLRRLAKLGTSCPDHFLRTKIRPLVLDLPKELSQNSNAFIRKEFEEYRKDYTSYYQRCKNPDSPDMRDPNPVVILCPGVGMITFAKNKQTARVAAEFYINAINVIKGAEAISTYEGLSEREAFHIEYWLLEEAKLRRQPIEKTLSRKIALITGGASGIGKAIAKKFLEEGACVVISDINRSLLSDVADELESVSGKDNIRSVESDVRNPEFVAKSFQQAATEFGGIDILVNSAGLARSNSVTETSSEEWDLLHDVMVKGQFLCCKEAVKIMKKQSQGGDIVNIVSKNALVSGPKNVAYGSAKAAQLHMSRLLAAELGTDQIRVNVVNPDAVIRGSNIWQDGWAEARAKAYGISVDELPAHYAKRTLLNAEIHAEDIANAVFVFVGGSLNKSTGNVLNVDGGLPEGFVR